MRRLKGIPGHITDPCGIDHIASVLEERCDTGSIIVEEIGPTVVTHAGPYTRGVFL